MDYLDAKTLDALFAPNYHVFGYPLIQHFRRASHTLSLQDMIKPGMFCAALLGVLLLSGCGGEPHKVTKSEAPSYPTNEELEANWPRFRGFGGLGISKDAGTPCAWNAKDGSMENIRWKSEVPFIGHSSPVVWKDHVFLTGYDAQDHRGIVLCYNGKTGALRWQKKVVLERGPDFHPPENLYDEAVGAASTMATDGRRAFAIFANGDLAAFDFEGNPAWSRALGVPDSLYGYAASLAMYRDLVIVQFDQAAEAEDRFASKLYAFRGETGEIAWEVDRHVIDSWTSPIVAETGKGPQLITMGTPWYIAYDPATGKEIWKVYMEGADMAPSPAFAAGLVFALVPNCDMCAIRTDGTGDVTETHIAWTWDLCIPDVASPVANDELFFLLSHGYLACLDARTGKTVWEHEYDSEFESSPTLVGDKLYLLGREGTAYIVASERAFKEIGRAELGEATSCSPAFVNDCIYIRGEKHLFCVGKK